MSLSKESIATDEIISHFQAEYKAQSR